jgi:hypothetical protein
VYLLYCLTVLHTILYIGIATIRPGFEFSKGIRFLGKSYVAILLLCVLKREIKSLVQTLKLRLTTLYKTHSCQRPFTKAVNGNFAVRRRYFCDNISHEVNTYTLETSLYGYKDSDLDDIVTYTDDMYCRYLHM